MKIVKIFFLFFLTFNKVNSGEITFIVTGIDEYPLYQKIDDANVFMTYSNRAQFTSNTSMYGFITCDGTIEIIKKQQYQSIMCSWTDSYGNKGYSKAIAARKKKIVGNMIGERIGSSVASWEFTGGQGPFEELKGTVMTGAYFQMGNNRHNDGNFIWRGLAEGVSDKVIERINNYILIDKK